MRNLQALFAAWPKRFNPLLLLLALMLIAILLTFLLSAGASAGASVHLFESPVFPPSAGLSPPPPPEERPAALEEQETPVPEEPIQPTAAPTRRLKARPTEPPSVVLDRGLLIDSVFVYMSYIWLSCGVLAMLALPLIFLILQVWGSQRRRGRAAKKRS